jgi:hypothetical protein
MNEWGCNAGRLRAKLKGRLAISHHFQEESQRAQIRALDTLSGTMKADDSKRSVKNDGRMPSTSPARRREVSLLR